jgi:Flp pilus assembly CpaF family ATPase
MSLIQGVNGPRDDQDDLPPDQIWTVRAAAASGEGVVDVDLTLVREIQRAVNAAMSEHERRTSASMTPDVQRQLAMKLISREIDDRSVARGMQGHGVMSDAEERVLRTAVFAAMFGLGHRLEALLGEDLIEDIYINGTRPVIVKLSDGSREIRPPVAESADDLLAQLSQIATHHGGNNARTVSATRPWLNLRLPGAARLAAVWDLTPDPIVTIRRHRYVDVTLEKLVAMGTLSASMAAFLHAAVIAGRSILVVGGQGSGKTTLLRALCQCIPATTRFATLETEYELLLHEIPGRFPGLIPYEARPGTGELDASGKSIGEVTLSDIFPESLRHSVDLYVFGETRGKEVFAMMQSMARGSKGALATMHADNALAAFDSLATLMAEYRDNWTMAAAMQQIAGSLDLVVFIDREEVQAGRNMRYVSEILEVGPVALDGRPSRNWIFQPLEDNKRREIDPRGYPVGLPTDQLWARRAGLDLTWLTLEHGQWNAPFPRRWGAE